MKSKNKEKKEFSRIFKQLSTKEYSLIFGVIVLFGGLNLWVRHNRQNVIEYGIKTIGTISDTGGKDLTVTYTIGGQENNAIIGQPFNTLEDEEEFIIKVDPNDKKNIVVEFWNPVFNKSLFSKTTSIKVKALWGSDNIEFYYKVDSQEYKRYQRLPPSFKDEDIVETRSYVVYFKKDNPEMAYLLL